MVLLGKITEEEFVGGADDGPVGILKGAPLSGYATPSMEQAASPAL